jgi:hypothetical protein
MTREDRRRPQAFRSTIGYPIRSPIGSTRLGTCSRVHCWVPCAYGSGMALLGDNYEVVGVSVAGVGPVASPVHLRLDASVQVLYGQNGAGKTRLLQMVSLALLGVAPRVDERPTSFADLHVRVIDPYRTDNGSFMRGVVSRIGAKVQDLRRALALSVANEQLQGVDIDELLERETTTDLWAHLAAMIDLTGMHETMAPGLDDDYYSAADAGLITLRAVGTAERPAWDAYLALPLAQESTRRRLASAKHGWQELLAIAELSDSEARDAQLARWFEVVGREGAMPLDAARPYGLSQGDPGSDRAAPDWLQLPTLLIAQEISGEPVRVVGNETATGVDDGTLNRLLALAAKIPGPTKVPLVTTGADGTTKLNAPLLTALRGIEQSAMQHAEAVLLEPPRLRFQLRTADDWLSGVRPAWEYYEKWNDRWLPIDQLSSARERWVRLSIELAAAPVDEVPAVFVCDEPERGLHRLAEGRLSRGLPSLALSRPFGVLAATHSPALLNSADIRPLLVSRPDSSGARVREVEISLLDRIHTETTAYELGLSVGDLWSLGRVIVVVEGLHDEMVFGSLLREGLNAAAAGLFPMHGGARLKSLAEPGLMINATDAQILVVLDELDSSVVDPIWDDLRRAMAQGDFDTARAKVAELRQPNNDSLLFLHQFAFRALETGCLPRVHVHGLSLPDVICYLPEEHVLLKPEPWAALIEQWRKDAAPNPPRNIKKWLKDRGYLPSDQAEIDELVGKAAHAAARAARSIHPDLVRLADHVETLASGELRRGE